MERGVGTRTAVRCLSRRVVHGASLLRCYGAVTERARLGCGGDRRLALIRRRAELRIRACSLDVLCLRRDGRNVSPLVSSLLLGSRTRVYAAVASVVADASHVRVVDDRRVIDVVHHGRVHVVDGLVVGEMAVVPAAAFISMTGVAVPVIDAAVEPDLLTPVPLVKDERAAA